MVIPIVVKAFRVVPKGMGKRPGEMEIKGRIRNIQDHRSVKIS